MQGYKLQLSLRVSIVPAIASLWLASNAIASRSNVGIVPQLVPAKPITVLSQQLPLSVPSDTSTQQHFSRQGDRIAINGLILPVAWSQRQPSANAGNIRTGISDTGLTRIFGAELLSTWNTAAQPVQWFSAPQTQPIILSTWLTNQYRYLDITDLATHMGWQLQTNGTTLQINLPPARVQDIRQEQQSQQTIVLDLDRPTPWQVSQEGTVLKVTIDAATDPAILQRTVPGNGTRERDSEEGEGEGQGGRGADGQRCRWAEVQMGRGAGGQMRIKTYILTRISAHLHKRTPAPLPICTSAQAHKSTSCPDATCPMPELCPIPQTPCPIKLESTSEQTTIRVNIPSGLRPRVLSLPNPYRLAIDFVPETMVERDIVWATGLRYRQQYIEIQDASSGKLLTSRFPVVWLEINPRQPGLTLKPIWSNPNTLVGIAPLIQTAQQWQVAAAINAGFFNRNTQLPLGAIRRDGRWLSSPILNRGAIAWNDLGEVKIGHLTLQNTLITSASERLPITAVNSGYIQPGIARHTPEWGATYTPLSDNETIIAIKNNQVISQTRAAKTNTNFPIPPDGYILAIRTKPELADLLAVGTTVRYESVPVPAEFVRYPHILGAGPVLLQNRQIVLDAKAEQFRDAFVRESAVRSAIATTNTGTLLIVTVSDRTGGTGPTLREMAQIIQQMGVIDALNLDGGSSTSLYLGGQLVNRPPGTAARIHNGLGIFLNPQALQR